ncbi:hypothetical protein IH982_01590 [Patescibacteria group bacterium]|nr:hypothetical protein [Patescibacteria group bacterium]
MKIKDQFCPICSTKMEVEITGKSEDRVNMRIWCPRLNCPRHKVKVIQGSLRELEEK